MLAFPLHGDFSSFYRFHLPPSSSSSYWNLSVSTRARALSGNDVNRVKCFQGPRGRQTQIFFFILGREFLTRTKIPTFFIFLSVYFSLSQACSTQKSSILLYSLSSLHFCGVQPSGGSCCFFYPVSFSFFSLFTPLLSSSLPRQWESSHGFRSMGLVWTSLWERGRWLSPCILRLACMFIINLKLTSFSSSAS